jgi:hypothetical protein
LFLEAEIDVPLNTSYHKNLSYAHLRIYQKKVKDINAVPMRAIISRSVVSYTI